MKKLMTILVFSGLLSVPSAVFAEASWYGSLRGGVEFSGGETNFYDGASRWGVKGSAEASEGLTTVYRFEHRFSTADAGLTTYNKKTDETRGGRLAYVGLSGGFGSLTLGQIWSASYNHAGVIRDFPNWHTSPDTSARVGNALSYAVSTDAFSMQIDAIMDGTKNTGKTVDQLEFGMTVNMGDLGKVALSHTTMYDSLMTGIVTEGMPAMHKAMYTGTTAGTRTDFAVQMISVMVAADDDTNLTDGALNVTGLGAITRTGDMYSIGECDADDAEADDACTTVYAYEETRTTYSNSAGVNTPTTTQNFYAHGVSDYDIETTPAVDEEMGTLVAATGYKANHLSVEFGLGALTAALGYSERKMNGASSSTKTTFVGAKGSIGDTGLNWGAFSRVKKNANGTKVKPWTVGVSRTLGGGAWTYVEHGNNGYSGSTVVGLGVNF